MNFFKEHISNAVIQILHIALYTSAMLSVYILVFTSGTLGQSPKIDASTVASAKVDSLQTLLQQDLHDLSAEANNKIDSLKQELSMAKAGKKAQAKSLGNLGVLF